LNTEADESITGPWEQGAATSERFDDPIPILSHFSFCIFHFAFIIRPDVAVAENQPEKTA
jgi:hypothetical protein